MKQGYLANQAAVAKGKGKGKAKRAPRGSGVFNVLAYKEFMESALEVLQDVTKDPMTYFEFEKLHIEKGIA